LKFFIFSKRAHPITIRRTEVPHVRYREDKIT
jgi:hypothetical protein